MLMIRRILRPAYWKIKRWLSHRGIQVSRGPSLHDYLTTRKIDVVLDIGANEGQFGRELRNWGYSGKIVSFEPVSHAYEALLRTSAADDRWEARRLAVGEHAGTITINVSANSVFSSALSLSPTGHNFSPSTRVVRRETVEIIRVDDFYNEFAGKRVFLKVDTQGSEHAVILGAAKSISELAGIQLELPIENLYSDAWGLTDALNEMDRLGFVPAQICPVNSLRGDRASAIEFDCIFRPKNSFNSDLKKDANNLN